MNEAHGQKTDLVEQFRGLLGGLRELAILGVAVLLVVWPGEVNRILTDAGFTKASFAGIDWEAKFERSNEQTKGVGQTVSEVQERLNGLLSEVEQTLKQGQTQSEMENLEKIIRELESLQAKTAAADRIIRTAVVAQERIIEETGGAKRSSQGWIFLGKVTDDKSEWAPGNPTTIATVDPLLTQGVELIIKDDVYLRGDPVGQWHTSGPILGAVPIGQTVELLANDYSPAKGGGWFVWAKVVRR